MFKPGSIRKVQVKNFVTYSYGELYPGPNLNMIIGPNGTGKSTLLAAIILGLGGSPKTVGRGKKISEYVKQNDREATINIYLQGHEPNSLIKITREFNLEEKNVWKLNNETKSAKDMMEYIKEFSIQVDNMCQFLPQDRVQDFAKLNKQELLRQTQVAIGQEDLIEKQEAIILQRAKHNELVYLLNKYNQNLAEATDTNNRLKAKVSNFRKMKYYLERIKHIDRKMAWIFYDSLKKRVEELAERKRKTEAEFKEQKNAAEPLKNALKNARQALANAQDKITKKKRKVQQHYESVVAELENYERLKQNIDSIMDDKTSKLQQIEGNLERIQQIQTNIQTLVDKKAEYLQEHNLDTMQQELRRLNANIHNLEGKALNMENEVEGTQEQKRQKLAEIRADENELARLENVKQQRLENLLRLNRDAHTAVLWFRNNTHLFKSTVYEPMLLEINVLNPAHAVYLQSTIPARDLVAFTCVNKEDVSILVRELREKKKLKVNVLYSAESSNSHFEPKMPIEQLRRYGLYAYVNTLFTAPQPIMDYLCKTYALHLIPIGNEDTNRCFADVPGHVTLFFSNNTRYSSTYSKYTKEKNIKQNQIMSNGTLSVSLDITKLEAIRKRIDNKQENVAALDNQKLTLIAQIKELRNHEISQLKVKAGRIQDIRKQIEVMDTRIRIMNSELQTMQNNTFTAEEVEKEADSKIKEVVKKMVQIQESIQNRYRIYTNSLIELKLENVNVSIYNKEVLSLSEKYNELEEFYIQAEEKLIEIRQEYDTLKREEQTAHTKALNLSNNSSPKSRGFSEFQAVHDELSNDLEQLDAERQNVMTKMECLTTADEQELKEYELTEKKIEEWGEKVVSANAELEKLTEQLEIAENEWSTPLKEMIAAVNHRFGIAFERMQCVGEVSLHTGADVKDYSQYGLCIKVSYRDGEPLQELNSFVQSGGERAVATAAYLLSLQELTPVPFRCVDEINQGMDVHNERKIFEMLVEATSQPNTSQYFLLTPKLVPDLSYVPTMKIHIIYNGPFLASHEKWEITELCNPERMHTN